MLQSKLCLITIVCTTQFLLGYETVSLQTAMKQSNIKIQYVPFYEPVSFHYNPFPFSQNPEQQPHKGLLSESFVATIINGKVLSDVGYIFAGNNLIKDFFSQYYPQSAHEHYVNAWLKGVKSYKHVKGKVAVLAKRDYFTYAHWLIEGLGRLHMLQKLGIEYDWLYVPINEPYEKEIIPFIKETLELLGVDSSKILHPDRGNMFIQADELIVPSSVARRIPALGEQNFSDWSPLSMYCPQWNLDFLRDLFIPIAEEQVDSSKFAEKIFISRQKASKRKMVNEDEIFALFEAKGFKRYCLEDLTFLEQVALFNQATHIVAAHGSALTNILFCKPGTFLMEMFQKRGDSTFYYIGQMLKMNHICIQTADKVGRNIIGDTAVSVELIQSYVDNCL